MTKIGPYEPSMEILFLADRFQDNIECSTTICDVQVSEIRLYGKKPIAKGCFKMP